MGKAVSFSERSSSRAPVLVTEAMSLDLSLENRTRLIAQVFAWLNKLYLDNKLLCLTVTKGRIAHGLLWQEKENITKHFHKREDKNTFLRVNILLFLNSCIIPILILEVSLVLGSFFFFKRTSNFL